MHTKSAIRNPKSAISPRSGQAMVELVVGLVALLAVFVGILQIGRLAAERNRTLAEARGRAGVYAFGATHWSDLPGAQLIRDWDRGNDERSHSRDDRAIAGSSLPFVEITSHAKPADLAARVPDNPISPMNTAAALGDLLLVRGRVRSDEIPLLPVVRHLLYDADHIRFDESAWLVWCEDLR